MASQMQSQNNHRRRPAGQGIVVRPSVGQSECRYCHEIGHHISRWNRQTRRKETTCPKLLAKEQRRQQHGGARYCPTARTANLSAWIMNAEKSVGMQGNGGRRTQTIGRRRYKAPTVAVSNHFDALADVETKTDGPAPVVAKSPVGVWGAPSVAKLLRCEEEKIAAPTPFSAAAAATAIAALLQRPVGVVPASPPKVTKKVSFAGDSENLLKPPCTTKVFDATAPADTISSDDEVVEKLVVGKNAWRPKARREGGAAVEDERVVFTRKLLAQKEKALADIKEEGSWADCEEQEELEEVVEKLKAQLARFTGSS